MNKSLFIFVFAVLAVLNLNASTDKTIHFSVPTMSVSSITMDVEYGNVVFYETSEDSLVVDVRIVMDNIAENKASKELKNYDVIHHVKDSILNLHQTRGRVTNTVRKYRFNYRIGIPKFYPIKIHSLFSSFDIPVWREKIDIDATYSHFRFSGCVGKLGTGKLKLKSSDIIADTLVVGNVNIDHGSISAKEFNKMSISAHYAKVNIDNCANATMTGESSQWKIKRIENVKFNTKYTLIKLGIAVGNVSVTNSFASVYIDEISSNSTTLNVKLDKGDLYVGTNFDILNYVYVTLEHASLGDDMKELDLPHRKDQSKEIYERRRSNGFSSKMYVNLRYGTMYNQ
ncbi:hypothetical protein K5X82_06850 [Halosquirtibacter xylanolyticus]|uniref:hypothetical protein n=1 Tax=Halosquirtibacter xylanolyticus TaxID=3374599 RepID=UPI00374A1949|nr:hypothetical protein K5X82_06850 [Prolixibacteraceae bacterium]